ncbi:cytochrome c556 [Streptomyces sp. V3I8]|uniref:hypothetical protein n=1 Tax=Streptomyces sp. V3I8 TaxID=3042279 RepID=UPI002786E5C3|nr:hypothetical protein [Streptomyces sp. V3I8]MDQ1037285.1 cytochrome c556 [Streptomyces sp. V3I8]
MGESTVQGVIIAVLGLIGSVLVAKISTPRERTALERMTDEPEEGELRVSPEIWRRFSVLEEKVDHLTAIVEQQKEKVTHLERLLRMAMRIIRRANRRLAVHQEAPEEIPRELVPYSFD